ncbi:hypothetical protein [Actinospongicola halichondriae]|uniref:hypothetical protein n=1 Tax=Actinospongicola halichondriae TaxID=3236844 RepID=UPI003D5484A5
MGTKLAEVAGWTVGVLVGIYVAFVATYALLIPECVTDGDTRDGRLYLAVNAVGSVVAIVGAAGITIRVHRTIDDERRFLAGPVFAASIVVLYVVALLLNGVTGMVLDVGQSTLSCF